MHSAAREIEHWGITVTTMTIAAPAKLPLFRTVGQAYALWMRNFSDLVRICWLWMLLMTPVLAIWNLMQAGSASRPFGDLTSSLLDLGRSVICLPAIASVAVAWHRLLLREEHPTPGVYLRLDRLVVGYAILAVWIELIGSAPSYLIYLAHRVTEASSQVTTGSDVAFWTAIVIAAIVGGFVTARLSLALPGIALGRNDVTLAMAWRVSKRNTWRMIWAYFFCLLPVIFVFVILAIGIQWIAIGTGRSQAVETLIWTVTDLLIMLPCGAISLSMLSLAYRHFFERGA